MEKISVIVPCYNEEKALPLFYKELQNNISKFPTDVTFEILFINDGSKDNTLKIIKDLQTKDNRIKYISFSRNFGKESAIYAGLENATGDYIRFLNISRGSRHELETQLLICVRVGYLTENQTALALKYCDEVGRMLNSLISKLSSNP